jgi:dihydrofolate synthase/folylpolyglutamate synthase
MELGLERIQRVLRSLRPARPGLAVQVAGTHGKGSTAACFAALARAHGLRAGLYTSPHFLTPRERILVDGRMLSPDAWTALANRVLDAEGGEALTYFELLTAMAALAFGEAGVDVAVYEAGLGGRHDATTALDADMVLFTRVGLDHCAVLGPTVAAIAADKAGAMRAGQTAVTCAQHPDAARVLAEAARACGARLRHASDAVTFDPETGRAQLDPRRLPGVLRDPAEPLPEPGPDAPAGTSPLRPEPPIPEPSLARELGLPRLQAALTALAGWHLHCLDAGRPMDPEACRRALVDTRVPGRLQAVPPQGAPEYLVDAAHNPESLQALGQELARRGRVPGAVVFTCLRDKDLEAMAAALAEWAAGLPAWVPDIHAPGRARPAAEVAAALAARGLDPRACADTPRALEQARAAAGKECVLVCGSLYLLAEFFTVRPECLGIADALPDESPDAPGSAA